MDELPVLSHWLLLRSPYSNVIQRKMRHHPGSAAAAALPVHLFFLCTKNAAGVRRRRQDLSHVVLPGAQDVGKQRQDGSNGTENADPDADEEDHPEQNGTDDADHGDGLEVRVLLALGRVELLEGLLPGGGSGGRGSAVGAVRSCNVAAAMWTCHKNCSLSP